MLDFAVTSSAGALAHGHWVWRAERALRLPDERAVQHFVLSHPFLIGPSNGYYRLGHYTGLLACLGWVFFFHGGQYRTCRRLLILATAVAIPLQTVPVAPPRMLRDLGLVDTAGPHRVAGPVAGLHDPAQVTAMPSVHVMWALLVALFVICVSRSRWRWLALLHPAATTLVVVATGNHFWADGIMAAALLGIVVSGDGMARRRQKRHVRPEPRTRTRPSDRHGGGRAPGQAPGVGLEPT
ncbi:MAG TPA: phosphatase PAP2 family protein, partial [Acidimicrobiales bacterium]|nr:phosphatase PAP2 family protein [Acidimicrobiales bacterium]